MCIQVFPLSSQPLLSLSLFLTLFFVLFNIGTSLIDSNTSQGDVPAASFTFYTINCTTGEREEVVLTIDGEFLIYLPLPADYKNEVKKKSRAHDTQT